MVKNLRVLVVGLLTIWSGASYADRVIPIYPFVNNGTLVMLNLNNPSTVAQQINIVYTATGDYYFDDASSHTGGDAFVCPGTLPQTCTLKPAYNSVPVGGLLQLTVSVKSKISSSSVSNISGVKGTMTITGDRGYLVGTLSADLNGSGTVMVPLAGGHAF